MKASKPKKTTIRKPAARKPAPGLRIREAAARCGKSEKFLRNLVADGFLIRQPDGRFIATDLRAGLARYNADKKLRAKGSEAAAALVAAKARAIEAKIDRKLGGMIPADEILKIQAAFVGELEAVLARAPEKCTDDPELRRKIKAGIADIIAKGRKQIAAQAKDWGRPVPTARSVAELF